MRRLLTITAPIVALTLFAPPLQAQTVTAVLVQPNAQDVQPVLCPRRYVDPVNGLDTNPGTLAQPWQTLTHAMWSTPAPGTIILLPGVYAPSTNGESYPIWMREDISIQGTDALNTVLKGEGSTILQFWAWPPEQDTFEDVLVDGLTITDGHAGIEMVEEGAASTPTIANCFIVENIYGIHMHVVYDYGGYYPWDDWDGNWYIEHRPKIINNTIAHNEIGILDDCNTLGQDPDGTVNGEADPAIINCIIYPNSSSDLEGVDGLDLHHTAFSTWDQAGLSQIRFNRPAPVSHVPIGGVLPSSLFVNFMTYDYRLLPGTTTATLVRDNGTTTQLSCANGTVAKRKFPCREDIFDVDCEGYGNTRVENGQIDLGGDEESQQIIAGYIPLTTMFGTDPNTGSQYFTYMLYMDPKPAMLPPLTATLYAGWIQSPGVNQYMMFWPTRTPGARMNGTTPPQPRPPFGNLLFDSNTLVPGMPMTITVPPIGIPWTTVLPPSASPVLYNQQLLPSDGTGAFGTLSNLQSYLISQ